MSSTMFGFEIRNSTKNMFNVTVHNMRSVKDTALIFYVVSPSQPPTHTHTAVSSLRQSEGKWRHKNHEIICFINNGKLIGAMKINCKKIMIPPQRPQFNILAFHRVWCGKRAAAAAAGVNYGAKIKWAIAWNMWP